MGRGEESIGRGSDFSDYSFLWGRRGEGWLGEQSIGRFFRLFFSFGREVWLGEQAIGRGSDFSDYSFLSRGDVAGRRVER